MRIPNFIKPMLSTLVDKPFDEHGWLYEIKWDGYRATTYIENGTVQIKSRNNKSFNEKFYPLFESLRKWKIRAIVDGEIVVINEKGIPDLAPCKVGGVKPMGNWCIIFLTFCGLREKI